jgi:hypothetical protein
VLPELASANAKLSAITGISRYARTRTARQSSLSTSIRCVCCGSLLDRILVWAESANGDGTLSCCGNLQRRRICSFSHSVDRVQHCRRPKVCSESALLPTTLSIYPYLCCDSEKEGRNLQKTSVTDGFFWRCKERSGTVIEPISNPRPLPCRPLPSLILLAISLRPRSLFGKDHGFALAVAPKYEDQLRAFLPSDYEFFAWRRQKKARVDANYEAADK